MKIKDVLKKIREFEAEKDSLIRQARMEAERRLVEHEEKLRRAHERRVRQALEEERERLEREFLEFKERLERRYREEERELQEKYERAEREVEAVAVQFFRRFMESS